MEPSSAPGKDEVNILDGGNPILDPYGNYAWLASKRRRMDSSDFLKNVTPNPNSTAYYGRMKRWSDIIKPTSDKRDYGVFTLPNKMKVIIISEPDVEKSAVALSVQAGSMMDPPQLCGTAHLIERMIMVANEMDATHHSFETFIEDKESGGDFSSFTQRDLTTFLFEVSPSLLPEALERFAPYFVSPTFPESAIEQEVNEIQEEHESRMQNDEERRAQVALSLTKPHHPFGQFDCGNKETLWTNPRENGTNIREELVKFYKNYYSADLMSLAVLGRESLDVLYDYVQCVFNTVPNNNKKAPRWMESPYGPDQLQTKIETVPQADFRKLLLIFPIPDYTPHYKTGTIPYLRFLLGAEGPGSLLSLLKKIQWVTGLEVDYEQPGSGFAFFTLDFTLTPSGIDNADNIVSHFFKYMKLLRKEGPQRRIWEEMRVINETKFRFLTKEPNFVENLVTLMPIVPREEILSCRYLLSQYRPGLIRELINYLMPRNLRIILSAKENEKIVNETEFWHGVKYRYSPIDEKLIQDWVNCGFLDDFRLPPPNPFIATNFDLKPRDEKSRNIPRIMVDNDLSRVWFLQENEFLVPKATIILVITSPLPRQEPINYNMARIMTKVIDNMLTEFTCSANTAGLTFNLETSINGLTLTIYGYDHKLQALFQYILNRIFHFCSYGNVGPHYDRIVEEYIRELWNWNEQEPYVHATEYVENILCHSWTSQQLLSAMSDEIPPARLVTFAQKFFSQVKLQWFFHGNFTEMEARLIYEEGLKYFHWVKSKPLPVSIRLENKDAMLTTGATNAFHMEHRKHVDSATIIVLQVGNGAETTKSNDSVEISNGSSSSSSSTVRNTIMMELIESILYEPATDILTNANKLVWTDVRKSKGAVALQIVVQGPKEPSFLEGCIEQFLTTMAQNIKSMPQDVFLQHCISLAVRKMEKPKTFWERSVKIFHEIFAQTFQFDIQAQEIKELQNVTQKGLVDFYHEWISPESLNRRKLCIRVSSGEERPIKEESTSSDKNSLCENCDSRTKLANARENVYSAKTEVSRTKSVIQKWTPTRCNSIPNHESPRGETTEALNDLTNTEAEAPLPVENTVETIEKKQSSTKDEKEFADETKSEDTMKTPQISKSKEDDDDIHKNEDESDECEDEVEESEKHTEQPDFESYYREIEEEIKILKNLKLYLSKEIKNQKKTESANRHCPLKSECNNNQDKEQERHGDELELKSNTKNSDSIVSDADINKDLETSDQLKIEQCKNYFQALILENETRHQQLNLNLAQRPPLEYNVYTLNSITMDQQQQQQNKQSTFSKNQDISNDPQNTLFMTEEEKPKKEKKTKKKNHALCADTKESLFAPSSADSPRCQGKIKDSHSSNSKSQSQSKDKVKTSRDKMKEKEDKEKGKSDSKISKRKSIGKSESSNPNQNQNQNNGKYFGISEKKSEGKILRVAKIPGNFANKTNSNPFGIAAIAERISSREREVTKEKSSTHAKKSKSKNITAPSEIQELDFDIKNEIKRLKNLRKLLDAKAKKILVDSDDSATSGTSGPSDAEDDGTEPEPEQLTGKTFGKNKSRKKSSQENADDSESDGRSIVSSSKKRSKCKSPSSTIPMPMPIENVAQENLDDEQPFAKQMSEEEEAKLRKIISIAKSKSKMGRLQKQSDARKTSLNKCLEDFKVKFGEQTLSQVLADVTGESINSIENENPPEAEDSISKEQEEEGEDEEDAGGEEEEEGELTDGGTCGNKSRLNPTESSKEKDDNANTTTMNMTVNTNPTFPILNKDSRDGSFRDEDLIHWLRNVVKSETTEKVKAISSKNKKKLKKGKDKEGHGRGRHSNDYEVGTDSPEKIRYSVPDPTMIPNYKSTTIEPSKPKLQKEREISEPPDLTEDSDSYEEEIEVEEMVVKKPKKKLIKEKERMKIIDAENFPNDEVKSISSSRRKTGPSIKSKTSKKRSVSKERESKNPAQFNQHYNINSSTQGQGQNGVYSRLNSNSNNFKNSTNKNNPAPPSSLNNNTGNNGKLTIFPRTGGGPMKTLNTNTNTNSNLNPNQHSNAQSLNPAINSSSGKAPFKTFGMVMATSQPKLPPHAKPSNSKKAAFSHSKTKESRADVEFYPGNSQTSISSNDYENEQRRNLNKNEESDYCIINGRGSETEVEEEINEQKKSNDYFSIPPKNNFRETPSLKNREPVIEKAKEVQQEEKVNNMEKDEKSDVVNMTNPEPETESENDKDDEEPPPRPSAHFPKKKGFQNHRQPKNLQCNPHYNFYDCVARRKSKSPPTNEDDNYHQNNQNSPPIPPRTYHHKKKRRGSREQLGFRNPNIGSFKHTHSTKLNVGNEVMKPISNIPPIRDKTGTVGENWVSKSSSSSSSHGKNVGYVGKKNSKDESKEEEKNMEFILEASRSKTWDASHVTIENQEPYKPQEQLFTMTRKNDSEFGVKGHGYHMDSESKKSHRNEYRDRDHGQELRTNNGNSSGKQRNVNVIENISEWKKDTNYFPTQKPLDFQ